MTRTRDTRTAILAAAATEFAARGFDGASVDAIAARSHCNKAMIYYHFGSKQGLYAEILRDVFRGLATATAQIADADLAPAAKIGGFLDAFNDMASTHSFMPPIMMREMAEGARRLDADTLGLMARIFGNLQRILEEGAARRAFRPADPLLTYFSFVTPVIFFHASAPIRAALGRQHVLPTARIDAAQFTAHLKGTVLAALSRSGSAPRKTRKRTRTSRPGDHA